MCQLIERMFCLLYLIPASLILAANYSRVDAHLKDYEKHVAEMNSEFDNIPENPTEKTWVKISFNIGLM